MARGGAALDMSKFFDTNYHYLVPELGPDVLGPATAAGAPLQPDFSGPLDKLARGQAVVGRERAVPILIGERALGAWPEPCAINVCWGCIRASKIRHSAVQPAVSSSACPCPSLLLIWLSVPFTPHCCCPQAP